MPFHSSTFSVLPHLHNLSDSKSAGMDVMGLIFDWRQRDKSGIFGQTKGPFPVEAKTTSSVQQLGSALPEGWLLKTDLRHRAPAEATLSSLMNAGMKAKGKWTLMKCRMRRCPSRGEECFYLHLSETSAWSRASIRVNKGLENVMFSKEMFFLLN